MSGIDLSFVSGKEKFNYRVCAVILSEGKLLAMQPGVGVSDHVHQAATL